MNEIDPIRGEIWLVDLNLTRGHEQSGKRPALVISVDFFNQGPAELVVVLPITTKDKKISLHVKIIPPEGNLSEISFVKCEDIRSISKNRLIRKLGSLSSTNLQSVEDRLRMLLSL